MQATLWAGALSLLLGAAAQAQPVTFEQYLAAPRPEPDVVLPYGPRDSQAIDVFLPPSEGPHPVVIFVHGGCWIEKNGGREFDRHLGPALAAEGVALWSIGYRRVDEPGGAYPGLYRDVATAIDLLPHEAGRLNLDPRRVVLVGHSAGGHLALWAAARAALPKGSPLASERGFVPPVVISLAGLGHLEATAPITAAACGADVLARLTGAPTPARPDVFADTDPARIGPTGTRKILISGVYDDIAPPWVAWKHAEAARARGETVTLIEIPGAGHMDLVTPGAPAWTRVMEEIKAALRRE